MDTVKTYAVVEKESRKVLVVYDNQAPATTYAKQHSASRVRWKKPDPVLIVEERTYVLESTKPVRTVLNGEIFDAPSD